MKTHISSDDRSSEYIYKKTILMSGMLCNRRRHACYVANSWYSTAWNKENGYEHYVENYSVQANCSSCRTYRSFATKVSQLKMCDFSGETFKGFEVLLFSMSATTTQLLSSGEFCKLRYDTIPVESASANVSSYTNNSKNAKFWFVTLLSQMSDMVKSLCSSASI